MKHTGWLIIPSLVAAINVSSLSAKENVSTGGARTTPLPPTIMASCNAATIQEDLAVNNVRARILMGDMWWDLKTAQYEVPKGGKISSIFAGSLWIGGVDIGGNLKVAGQTYRQTGHDFWPGPLNVNTVSIDKEDCEKYDRHFRVTRKEVEAFVSTGVSTPAILNWPGNGDASKSQDPLLAPFFDKNNNGVYEPSAGDYPGYDLVQGDNFGDCQAVNCIPVDQLFGDETIWWVFNDVGNIHTETGGKAIGIEIRAQAFGFFTDDEINNMTFYNYRIFNRSTVQVDSCYFGVWADADLGEATDDYIGCDVERGLGYTYNADNYDDPPNGYGNNPPAVGIDFFRGPIADAGDGKDNDRNCNIDESCEQIVMSGYLYYDNTNNVPYGNPSGATHFYNYLKMKWGDGVPVTYGMTGYNSGGPACNFMYPGNPSTDLHDWGIGGNCSTSPTLPGWDELSVPNTPQDRRQLESAGPFTLKPGAVNVITTGVVWARAASGGAGASVKLLKIVDDKAQALFDNCFRVLNGPDAPDMTIQELENKIVLYLSNTNPGSNNYNETYQEFDPLISLVDSNGNTCSTLDPYYRFQGYKVYQLKNATVSSSELENADRARLIYQCDVKDGVDRIINYNFDQALGAAVAKEMVVGANAGIKHSLLVTSDAFSTGSPTLINHKTYYFMAVAYGYNQFKKYQQDMPTSNLDMCNPAIGATTGQKKPYKQGRKNIAVYSAIPHNPAPESGGTEVHGEYASGPIVKRIEGNGNGGMALEFTSGTVSDILNSSVSRAAVLSYESGSGPIGVKVIDPLNVPDGHSFVLKFDTTARIDFQAGAGAFYTGTVAIGDTIKGKTSSALGIVIFADKSRVRLRKVSGTFQFGEIIKGAGLADSAKILNFLPQRPAASSLWDNQLDRSNWVLTNTTTGEVVYADKSIQGGNEQLIPQWGISVTLEQVGLPGVPAAGATPSVNNGFIGASMTFADGRKTWLTGLADLDGSTFQNWIRSGTIATGTHQDYPGVDDEQIYEGVVGGTWSPYRTVGTTTTSPTANFAAGYYAGPGFKSNFLASSPLSKLASVDVVLTSDVSKWTRCVVLELGEDSNYTINTSSDYTNRARKLDFRRAPSVNQAGQPDPGYDYPTGMGWFPGYAVNLETGERLNIAFGENSMLSKASGARGITYHNLTGTFFPGEVVTGSISGATGTVLVDNGATYLTLEKVTGVFDKEEIITGGTSAANARVTAEYDFEQNGGDMRWNPTSNITGRAPWTTTSTAPVIGGQHYIYIFGHNNDNTPTGTIPIDTMNVPRYDKGKRIRDILGMNNGQAIDTRKREIFADAMWVNLPLLIKGHSVLESDVTIRLRVAKPYRPTYGTAFYKANPTTFVYGDSASPSVNKNLPMYTFTTEGIATHTNEAEVAKEALDMIRVVPNPYYAFSYYETSRTDNRVKITNLPETCTISIYNVSGTLIRKFKKGEPMTGHKPKGTDDAASWHDGSLDWDLKNLVGIPISSGVYIIHVEVPGVGEKIVKWFGVMRPVDLDAF